MQDFEKLGAFYLGKRFDPEARARTEDLLLYDSRDLLTHAVCVGMTGSGKTGLCLSLLEEAALDGIPAIAIDPKGDLGNLLLTFPELLPEDFVPWVDDGEARRRDQTLEERAAEVAATWREGLADWGQGPERIARLRDTVDLSIYTPGSSAGLPLNVLRSFDAPSEALAADPDAVLERIGNAVSGLLGLLGVDADPIQSPAHVFLANVLRDAWSRGEDLGLAELIRRIQDPPITQIGVMDLDTFYPKKRRQELAMKLNALLASPGFAPWLEGEPLDIGSLLMTPAGKPRLTILNIAHLGDAERMFFVTLLLSEVVAWMRSQPGTTSLRALLYMDEVFGFLPPVQNPPSKRPMLTLLKQARAFGLGCVLATQNPVDVDYKALSNCGTWFLGRLQTERDVDRVMDGLAGAASAAGQSLDASALRATLAGLESRVFLMNDVHEPAPVLFQTRWALSYLRGPLTRSQIKSLMDERRGRPALASPPLGAAPAPEDPETAARAVSLAPPVPVASPEPDDEAPGDATLPDYTSAEPTALEAGERPALPEHVEAVFVGQPTDHFVYQPGVMATLRLHYAHARAGIDTWYTPTFLAPLEEEPGAVFAHAHVYEEAALDVTTAPALGAVGYLPIPKGCLGKGALRSLQAAAKRHAHENHTICLGHCPPYKLYSSIGESRAAFAARCQLVAREERDEAVHKLRERYERRLAKQQERVHKALSKVERERAQLARRKVDAAVSVGTTVFGALFGRRSVGRAGSAARSAGRVGAEQGDVRRAQEDVAARHAELEDLEEELDDAVAGARQDHERPSTIEELVIRPRKRDIEVVRFALAWVPVPLS